MDDKPGRTKGAKVIACHRCGARLAGKPGTKVPCRACGRNTLVSAKAKPVKKVRVFL